MKTCRSCRKSQPKTDFSKGTNRDGLQSWCKTCQKVYNRQHHKKPERKEYMRWYFFRSKYGLSKEQYETLYQKQKGCCGICGCPAEEDRRPLKQGQTHGLCVDHNHKTGVIRGLLCDVCNRGLGFFKEDTKLLEKAVLYLSTEGAKLYPELQLSP